MDNEAVLKALRDMALRQVEMMAYIESLIEDYAELIANSETPKQAVYNRIMISAQLKIDELRGQA